jgi:hypothetical protein
MIHKHAIHDQPDGTSTSTSMSKSTSRNVLLFGVERWALSVEYGVRGRRRMDCIDRMVMRSSDREIASQRFLMFF